MSNNYFLKMFLDNVIMNPNDIAIEIGLSKMSYKDLFIEANLLVNKIDYNVTNCQYQFSPLYRNNFIN